MAKNSDQDKLIIVGIGASAGGLEAISTLITNLPKNMSAAYVIAQHMSPTHKSLLAVLVARETKLAVVELGKTPEQPKEDTIYVTPPNSDVILQDGMLRLVEPSGHPAVPKPSADRLLNSIADECGSACVGIVLSGTGADGSYGVQAIRKEGGITIAQEPQSAKYEGMPQSAIETGCIDIILPPDEIGTQFERILFQPGGFVQPEKKSVPEDDYSELLRLLLDKTRLDFADYKENTILRRIQRRMVALDIDTFEAYVHHCRGSVEEVMTLQRDLLISVTRFFRDPQQFIQLEREIRKLVNHKEEERLRVWVVGCATGEEAYSIAILFAEALGGLEHLDQGRIQIFATDVDENALQIARKGIYPAAALQDIPQDLADKYFRFKSNALEVIPEIRAITLFSKHNVFTDPPFMRVDLVSLRNVMIYFNADLQKRVLSRIHYTLVDEGLLFLGTSESLGEMENFFEQVPSSDKVFVSRKSTHPYPFSVPDADNLRSFKSHPSLKPQLAHTGIDVDPDNQMFLALARAVAKNGFIAVRNNDIVRVFGDMTPFMELTETTNPRMSLRILKKGLRDEAPSLVSMALKSKSVREGRWHILDGHDFNRVRLQCYPVIAASDGDRVLVSVQTRMETDTPQPVESLSDKERTQYILEIETEMQSTREALQQTVEELQTSNEALQSVNEELQSTNEELQATNEELETSNEELQSTNEELITVNEEMQINASELDLVSTELTAVMSASPYPLLVLDEALIVRRASDTGLRFLSLDTMPATGLHLSQCNLPAEFPTLTHIAENCIAERTSRSIKFDVGKKSYTAAFAHFVDSHSNQFGLTITFYDTDAQAIETQAETMEQLANVGSWSFNPQTRTLLFSPNVSQTLGLSQQSMSLNDAQVFLHEEERERVLEAVHQAYVKADSFSLDARCLTRSGTEITVKFAGKPVHNTAGKLTSYVGACQDVSREEINKQLIAALQFSHSELGLQTLVYDVEKDILNAAADVSGLAGFQNLQLPSAGYAALLDSLQREGRSAASKAISELQQTGGVAHLDVRLSRRRGANANARLDIHAPTDAHGAVAYIYFTLRPQEL